MKHMGYFGPLEQPPYGLLALPYLPGTERAALARPDILNGPAAFLAGLAPGALTGVSLNQQRWDEDAGYRRALVRGRDA